MKRNWLVYLYAQLFSHPFPLSLFSQLIPLPNIDFFSSLSMRFLVLSLLFWLLPINLPDNDSLKLLKTRLSPDTKKLLKFMKIFAFIIIQALCMIESDAGIFFHRPLHCPQASFCYFDFSWNRYEALWHVKIKGKFMHHRTAYKRWWTC